MCALGGCKCSARVNQEERRRGGEREESRGCDEGKFRAVLSGKGWLRARSGETEKWKGIMGCDGSARHPLENYDSSFNAIEHILVSRGSFKSSDLSLP